MAWSNIGGGGGENVTAEVAEQTPLIQQIRETIVGKATLANATPDKIVKGYSAYVGQELVNGTLEPLTGIDFGTVTLSSEQTSVVIEHSLGTSNIDAYLISKGVTFPTGNTNYTNLISASTSLTATNQFYGYYGSDSNYNYRLSSNPCEITETQITFDNVNGYNKFRAGEYYWFAVKK